MCTRLVLQVCFIQITVDDPKGTWIATLVTSMWKIPNSPRLLETWDEGFFFPPPRGDKYLADLAAFRGMDLKESQELISHYQDPCRLRHGGSFTSVSRRGRGSLCPHPDGWLWRQHPLHPHDVTWQAGLLSWSVCLKACQDSTAGKGASKST